MPTTSSATYSYSSICLQAGVSLTDQQGRGRTVRSRSDVHDIVYNEILLFAYPSPANAASPASASRRQSEGEVDGNCHRLDNATRKAAASTLSANDGRRGIER